MPVSIRKYHDTDLKEMIDIWNEIVREGNAFPQIEELNVESAELFFENQSFTGVAADQDSVAGLYILHPNNIGRCAHIANASYAVKSGLRGEKIGEKLVLHSMEKAKELGFRVLQFNAVVVTNTIALRLYKKLGFTQLGVIPGGFLSMKNEYMDIIPHFIELQ